MVLYTHKPVINFTMSDGDNRYIDCTIIGRVEQLSDCEL